MANYSDAAGGKKETGKMSSYSGYSQEYRRQKFAYTQARSHGTPF